MCDNTRVSKTQCRQRAWLPGFFQSAGTKMQSVCQEAIANRNSTLSARISRTPLHDLDDGEPM